MEVLTQALPLGAHLSYRDGAGRELDQLSRGQRLQQHVVRAASERERTTRASTP